MPRFQGVGALSRTEPKYRRLARGEAKTLSSKTVAKNMGKSLGNEILGLVLIAAAVFVLASLLTYDPKDPSLFSHTRSVAGNACGWIGAQVSAVLLHGVGLGSFLVPFALLFMAANLYRKEGWVRLLGLLAGMCVAVVALTVFVSFHWKYWPYSGGLLLTGGAFGTWIAEGLAKPLNPLGASIVSGLVFVLALVVSTPVSVAKGIGDFMVRLTDLIWRVIKLALTYSAIVLGRMTVWVAKNFQVLVRRFSKSVAERSKERFQAIRESVQERKTKLLESKTKGVAIEVENEILEPPEEQERIEPALFSEEQCYTEFDPPPVSTYEPPNDQDTTLSGPEIHERTVSETKKARVKLNRGNWKLPTPDFLKVPPKIESNVDRDQIFKNADILVEKLRDFGIQGEVTAVRPGPVITLYEFKPGPGIKVSRIAALADDLSMALSAASVRILAPLPGKSVVGIEIPSENREMVYLREFLQRETFHDSKYSIPIVMGKDIGGQPELSDLARMPHLLIAGQTGSGKSVFMNSLICSMLYRFTPDELRMILVDPKFIEFRSYQDIPHLLLPVVDDPKQASISLKWAVKEMERRYRILAIMGARNLSSYNQKVDEMGHDVIRDLLLSEENQSPASLSGSGSDWIESFETDESGQPRIGKLPYIMVVIDELADLMMIARKEVELSIARIAQKARAAGIHLVVATQRPSTDVITGLIKANLPSRVSFQLASSVDSKTILDRGGAEKLLGSGDMLFVPPGSFKLQRLHGAYVSDEEIDKITAYLKSQGEPDYREEILEEEDDETSPDQEGSGDELFEEAVHLVRRSGHASASFLQRNMRIGYNRAARMIEIMEERGIVGPADGSRPREVLLR